MQFQTSTTFTSRISSFPPVLPPPHTPHGRVMGLDSGRCIVFFFFLLSFSLPRYAYLIRRDAVRFQVPTVSGSCLDRKEPGLVRKSLLQLALIQILRKIDATWEVDFILRFLNSTYPSPSPHCRNVCPSYKLFVGPEYWHSCFQLIDFAHTHTHTHTAPTH